MLTDGKITVRSFADRDASSLASLANNKKVWDNLRDFIPYPYTTGDAVFFINLTRNENPRMTFAIDYEGQLCGVISLVAQTDVYKKTAEIGYWIGESFWNKGIAIKAVNIITNYGFDQLGLVRIYTGVFEYNDASMKVLEKCGYKKDGVFEKAIIKNDQILNEHRYSKIK